MTDGNARTGWAWGWLGRSGEWLVIPGSAYERPDLPTEVTEAAPPPAELADQLTLARVAELAHPGVTTPRGMAYRVLGLADPTAADPTAREAAELADLTGIAVHPARSGELAVYAWCVTCNARDKATPPVTERPVTNLADLLRAARTHNAEVHRTAY